MNNTHSFESDLPDDQTLIALGRHRKHARETQTYPLKALVHWFLFLVIFPILAALIAFLLPFALSYPGGK